VLRIFGDDVPLSARVETLNGYSAHGDRTQLHHWLSAVREGGRAEGRDRPSVYLVHGEPDAQDAFAERLRADHFAVRIPSPGEHHGF
jgi:metallo-beta-lactamase family protein